MSLHSLHLINLPTIKDTTIPKCPYHLIQYEGWRPFIVFSQLYYIIPVIFGGTK